MPLPIHLPGAYRYVGWARDHGWYNGLCSPNFPADSFVLVLYWPKIETDDGRDEWSFLKLEVTDHAGFGAQPEHLESVLKTIGCTNEAVGTYLKWFQEKQYHFCAGIVRRQEQLHIRTEVDTDDPNLWKHCKKPPADLRLPDRESLVLPIIAWQTAGRSDAKDKLWICGLREELPPKYLGVVALDLGNTSSTLACYEVVAEDRRATGGQSESERIVVLPDQRYADIREFPMDKGARPVASTLRIETMTDEQSIAPADLEKALADYDAFEWHIGVAAREDAPSSDGLVMGPKRLVVRDDERQRMFVVPANIRDAAGRTEENTTKSQLQIGNRIPAELFICRMLEMFQASRSFRPSALVITYPTSYSRWEIERLKQTVYRAYWRSQRRLVEYLQRDGSQPEGNGPAAPPVASPWNNRSPYFVDEEPFQPPPTTVSGPPAAADQTHEFPSIDKAIPMVLDEATAAGVFFLHREIREVPGGLRRFRYLYPEGFNLFLYDCGGGTTDMAIVHGQVAENGSLSIKVWGRSGVRDFGGDNITEAIFKLLKAKLALGLKAMAGSSGDSARSLREEFPNLADDGQGKLLAQYLERNAEQIDVLVPTRFSRDRFDGQARGLRRNALALWQWAERVKRQLGDRDIREFGESEMRDTVVSGDYLVKYLSRGDAQAMLRITGIMQQIKLKRAEIDALIWKSVQRSVDCGNHLIANKLADREEGPAWVDCLCVVGNGSRYPLIRELLKEKLNVPFLFLKKEQEKKGDADDRNKKGVKEEDKTDPARYRFEVDHLKHAVGKGAVLARLLETVVVGPPPDLESDLSNRLPYDVGYEDVTVNVCRPLYNEGDEYGNLGDREIRLPPRVGNHHSGQEWIVLCQRWPGEEKWLQFLYFEFPKGAKDRVIVYFNLESRDFWARTDSGEAVQARRTLSEEVYLSPVQRGTL